MRILFLECDGVLHPARTTSRFVRSVPLKQAVQDAWLFRWAWILDELLNGQPDIGIVVHSNWRYLATNQELQSFLGPLAPRFAGTVPLAPPGNRWESIREIIELNHLRDYRILDCLPSAFPEALPELIVCHPEIGLQAYSVRRQIRNWAQSTEHAVPVNS
ncbi:HAD domain-containing protein [Oxalobacteraceae bacterium R-40]|uniref:HAD domain-containing protein n=1 Tax=Keguizhuia sedimenti TaxID=3064264 RepID=A0ABU1BNV6_9BURK|nr:HAD domain-containing protein [Oxalobacteraceae bacterium R-40]